MDEHHYYIGGRLMSAVIAYNTDLVSKEDAPGPGTTCWIPDGTGRS